MDTYTGREGGIPLWYRCVLLSACSRLTLLSPLTSQVDRERERGRDMYDGFGPAEKKADPWGEEREDRPFSQSRDPWLNKKEEKEADDVFGFDKKKNDSSERKKGDFWGEDDDARGRGKGETAGERDRRRDREYPTDGYKEELYSASSRWDHDRHDRDHRDHRVGPPRDNQQPDRTAQTQTNSRRFNAGFTPFLRRFTPDKAMLRPF